MTWRAPRRHSDSYWSIAHPDPRRAFVALGSNVGDRVEYLARACELINAIPLTCVTGVSHAYETDPAYGIALPVANAVAEIKTELAPLVLLDALMGVEEASSAASASPDRKATAPAPSTAIFSGWRARPTPAASSPCRIRS